MNVTYKTDLSGIDWPALKETLTADHFDNGRSPEQLQRSFENSYAACFAVIDGRIIGKARSLSDGVCNGYVVDVWTHSDFRRQGIASTMMRTLLDQLSGQHVYLFTDDRTDFYQTLGFKPQPTGLGMVVGKWLGENQ